IRFLSFERDAGEDLNGDGDMDDLVLQLVNARQHSTAPKQLGTARRGVCTTTGEACSDDAPCVPGQCFVPPGRCLDQLGIDCDPSQPTCPKGSFCTATNGCVAA